METSSSRLESNRYFRIALAKIKNHPFADEVKSLHSSVLVKGGKIISVGINKPKRNMFSRLYSHHPDCSIHSEIDAIFHARKKTHLRGTKLYVARLLKEDHSIGMSRPCPNCMAAIRNYGIKKVYYTTDSGDYERISI